MKFPVLSRLFGRSDPHAFTSRSLREGSAEEFRQDGSGYQGRRTGGRDDDADLTEEQRRRARIESRRQYHSNGIYGAVVDRFVDHAVGDGVTIEVTDPDAQAWLDEQFGKRENRFHETLGQRIARFIVDGEMPFLISTLVRSKGKPTRDFFLGRLDLDGVADVRVSNFNHDAVIGLIYSLAGSASEKKHVELPIAGPGVPLQEVDGDLTPVAPVSFGQEAESTVPPRLVALQFWQARTIGRRSGPLFSRILDRVSSLDEVLEEFIRKFEYLNRFWLHVKHKKVNDESSGKASKDKQFAKSMVESLTSGDSGEVIVTGEDVSIAAMAPDLEVQNLKEVYDIFLDLILGAYAVPRHWFSSGGDTNRATAAEQGSPIYRFIKSWQQSVLKPIITDLVSYLLYIGEEAKVPGVKADLEFTVSMADIATRDSLRDADEMMRVELSLREYLLDGVITKEEFVKALRAFLSSKWVGEHMGEAPDEGEVDVQDDAVDALDDASAEGAQPEDDDTTPAGQEIPPPPPVGSGVR